MERILVPIQLLYPLEFVQFSLLEMVLIGNLDFSFLYEGKIIENDGNIGNGRNGRLIFLPFLFLFVLLQPMRENPLLPTPYML